MRKTQKIVATALSAAVAASMCVAVPATAAFADGAAGATAGATDTETIAFDADKMNSATDQFYTGEPRTPYSITWNAKGDYGKLKEGVDYTVEYKDNIKKGTATATITGIGKYSGVITKTFKIIDFTFDVLYEGKTLATMDKAAIDALTKSSKDNNVDYYYQYGKDGQNYVCYVPAKAYVTVASVMQAEDVSSWAGLKVAAVDGFGYALAAATDAEAKFWPGQTADSTAITDGAQDAPAIIADSCSEAPITTTAAEAAAAAKEAYASSKKTDQSRLFVGCSEDEYKAYRMPGSRYVTGICRFNILGEYAMKDTNPVKVAKAKATVKKGKTVAVKVSKAQGKVAVKSSKKSVAKVTYSKKTGKVTIKGVKKGKATITVSAAGTKDYKAGTKTIKVTVK